MQSGNLFRVVIVTVLVLLVHLASMQFSDEVGWSLADFVVTGTLLLGVGLAYELSVRNIRSTNQRMMIGAASLAALLAIWVELAVGLFDIPFAGS